MGRLHVSCRERRRTREGGGDLEFWISLPWRNLGSLGDGESEAEEETEQRRKEETGE
jgi:hypothetical protein